jgi:hydrogenase maturation protease
LRVLVAGVGNIFLGDDGFGPEVARRLATTTTPGVGDVRVVDYGIRGMHLAYDLLDGYDALVLVDTVPPAATDEPPGTVRVLEVRADDLGSGVFDAHGMDPVAVLASLDALGGSLPPTYVVGCVPMTLAERIGLSDPVAAAVPDAVATTRRLVEDVVASRTVGGW